MSARARLRPRAPRPWLLCVGLIGGPGCSDFDANVGAVHQAATSCAASDPAAAGCVGDGGGCPCGQDAASTASSGSYGSFTR